MHTFFINKNIWGYNPAGFTIYASKMTSCWSVMDRKKDQLRRINNLLHETLGLSDPIIVDFVHDLATSSSDAEHLAGKLRDAQAVDLASDSQLLQFAKSLYEISSQGNGAQKLSREQIRFQEAVAFEKKVRSYKPVYEDEE